MSLAISRPRSACSVQDELMLSSENLRRELLLSTPRSPLSQFCKDQYTNHSDSVTVHKIDKILLAEHAESMYRRRVLSAKSRDRRASSQSCARSTSTEPSTPFKNAHQHVCEMQRRLSLDEKQENCRRAVEYFHKAKEANEVIARAPARSGSRGSMRRPSLPTLPTGPSSTPNLRSTRSNTSVGRGASKESQATDSTKTSSRRGSKEAAEVSAVVIKDERPHELALEAKSEESEAAPPPKKISAHQRWMATIPKVRTSLVAMQAAKNIINAGQPASVGDPAEASKPRQSSAIGGSIIAGNNTLLQRLKEKRHTVE